MRSFMEKIYILDTNVLIQAPYAVECFEDNEVVLPMTVLEELDNLKKESWIGVRLIFRDEARSASFIFWPGRR